MKIKKIIISLLAVVMIFGTVSGYNSAVLQKPDHFTFYKASYNQLVRIEEGFYDCEFIPEFPYDCIMMA